ncbi:MAG: AN1-type zinc finger domain-containing protein [Candidatus Bathyarchaeia archaeon]
MKCQYCGSDTGLPFRCPFCGGLFCVEHRLPEAHMCQNFRRDSGIWRKPSSPPYRRSVSKFSITFRRSISNIVRSPETIHVCLAATVVALVGLSTAVNVVGYLNKLLVSLLVLIFVISFMLHEMLHKFSAKHYGLWAEFRLSPLGVLITLISIFTPFIKIVSPGSVMIYGWADKKVIGKISLAGPLANIVLSAIFLMALLSNLCSPSLRIACLWGLAINAYIALFNLIPFSILDGAKIFRWSKHIWVIMFTIALTLTVAFIYLY